MRTEAGGSTTEIGSGEAAVGEWRDGWEAPQVLGPWLSGRTRVEG